MNTINRREPDHDNATSAHCFSVGFHVDGMQAVHRDGNHDTYQVNEKERKRERERERGGVRSRAIDDERERESGRDGNRDKRLWVRRER